MGLAGRLELQARKDRKARPALQDRKDRKEPMASKEQSDRQALSDLRAYRASKAQLEPLLRLRLQSTAWGSPPLGFL